MVRGGLFSGSLPCTIKLQLHVGFSLDFSSHKPPFPWKMKDRCICHYQCMLRVLGGKTNIKYYLPPEWFPSKELSNLAICTRMKILQPSIPVPTDTAPAFLSISPHLPKPHVSLMYCSTQYLSPLVFFYKIHYFGWVSDSRKVTKIIQWVLTCPLLRPHHQHCRPSWSFCQK